jgi:hypothetical protein
MAAGALYSQHRFKEPAIVRSRSTTIAFLARQDRVDFLPHFVTQQRSNHPVPLTQKTGCKHSSANENRS